MTDFARIATDALSNAKALLPRWLPSGRWEGDEWVALNPLRPDENPGSFKVNRQTGRWSDFATEDKGGDLISLYAYLQQVTQGEGARRLAIELHVNGDSTRSKNAAHQKSQRLTLSLSDLAEAKGLPVEFLEKNGVTQDGGYVKFTYYLPDGLPAPRHRLRRALTGKKRFLWNKGSAQIIPYGLDRLSSASAAGTMYLVEGETDTLTLWLHGYHALGMPGADTFRLLRSEYLEGISTVFIVCETDRGGSTFLSKGLARLTELRVCRSLRALKMPPDVKDPNELHLRWLGDPGAFESEWNEQSRTAEVIDPTSSSPKNKNDSDSEDRPPEFSDDQLALDFAAAHADGLRHVAAWNQWFMWNEARWAEDKTLHTFDYVRRVCRRAAARLITNAENPEKVQKLASGIASAKTVAAVHSFGRADRRLAATDSQWDLGSDGPQYARRHHRPPNRRPPSSRPKRIFDQEHRGHTARYCGLPKVAGIARADIRRRHRTH